MAGLRGLPVEVLPCEGTYFPDRELPADQRPARRPVRHRVDRKHGVATIPLSAFGGVAPEARLIRLCFAKKDATLDEALSRLHKAWT